MTDDFADGWDLAEVVAERVQPTEEVTIYLSEAASKAKSDLVKLASTKKGDELAVIEKQIAAVDKEIESKKYVVTIAAIPNRMLEDIQTKGMVEVPMKLDFVGRDDPANQIARNRTTTIMLWNAQIKDVVNPDGKSKKVWSLEETEKFHDAIPGPAQAAINDMIADLRERAEEYSVKSKNVDF